MAKELPYFKFEPSEWENGNIQMCTREEKGLFIDLCALYWSRLGDVPLKLAIQKLCGGNATAFDSLIDSHLFRIQDESIYIEFLEEQLQEFENLSNQNKKNALLGWEKRRETKGLSDRNATALISQCENDAIREEKKREDKRKEEKKKINKKENFQIPSLNEFFLYAQSIPEFKNDFEQLKFSIQSKYETWVSDEWKDGHGVKIKNWKTKLKNTLPYLKKVNNANTQQPISNEERRRSYIERVLHGNNEPIDSQRSHNGEDNSAFDVVEIVES
jgi:hypothetical protein